MRVGIIGAGAIARSLSRTINGMKDVSLYAVASRSLDKAESFAHEFGAEKYYGNYEDLVNDKDVDLVYIATPHSHHFEHASLCLDNSKPVLCEKSFTRNSTEAKKLFDLASEKKVFITEAIWTRYMPSRKIIDDMVSSGIVGKIKSLTANLSYTMTQKERLLKPELAGGALLDVGVYPLNFASMHFGNEIEKMESSVLFTDTGVDAMESITLFYKDGKMAFLNAGMYARSDRQGIFYGEGGYIVVENINNPQTVTAFDSDDKLLTRVQVPSQITGYEYQLLECKRCLEEGLLESPMMSHEETLLIMRQMDALRKDWGLVYPGE